MNPASTQPPYDQVVEALRDALSIAPTDGHQQMHSIKERVREVLRLAEAAPTPKEWKPLADGEPDGLRVPHILVRHDEMYRYLRYRPDGVRQMKKPGRWQKFNGHGWDNAAFPEGAEWTPNPPAECMTTRGEE